jgi:membrane protease YdiL (CAAX protease family)
LAKPRRVDDVVEPGRAQRDAILLVALALAAWCVGMFFSELVGGLLTHAPFAAARPVLTASTLWTREIVVLVVAVAGYRWAFPESSLAPVGIRASSIGNALLGVLFGIAFVAAMSFVERTFHVGSWASTVAAFVSDPQRAAGLTRVLLPLQIGLFSPVVQEITFRGLIYTGLSRLFRPDIAVVASAAVFSLSHASSGPFALAHSFVFGLIAAELFRRTKSLLPSTCMHVVVNGFSQVAALLR